MALEDIKEEGLSYILEEESLVERDTGWVEFGCGKATLIMKDDSKKEVQLQQDMLEKLKNLCKNTPIFSKNLRGDIELHFSNNILARKLKLGEFEILDEEHKDIVEKYKQLMEKLVSEW
jgi:hypothetical protein